MTPNPQANTVDEILNYCRVNYAPEAIHDEYEEQVKSRVKALITEARIDEVEGIINMPPDFDDFCVYLPYRLKQLKENK